MKIIFTIHDAGMAVNVGGAVESISSVIEIDDDKLPLSVQRFMNATREGERHYMNLSLSYVHPDDERDAKEEG